MRPEVRNILVIDDEEEIANAAKRMLERSGFSVHTANNGKQGMDLVSQSRPDVIITDIIMPIMDGYEFFKKLKNENRTCDIPVIILTARPNMEDSFRALGVQGFVTKPFTSESLINKIKQLSEEEFTSGTRGQVLVTGSDEYTSNHIAVLLKDNGYAARACEDGSDLVHKALAKAPNFIFLDVQMKSIPCRELIRALRCFHLLDETKIIVYTNFSPENKGAFDHVDYLQEAKETCLRAGADYYIGRFSSVNFIDSFNNFRNSLQGS